MLDISLLNIAMPHSENPGLDTLDTRFQEIATLVQNEEIPQAANQIEALFKENIFDIRLIGYYVYAVFQEQGIKASSQIFTTLVKTFSENWEAIGPAKKKDRHTKVSVIWFLSRFLKMAQYHQGKADETWNSWLTCTPDESQAIIDSALQLKTTLSNIIQDEETQDQIGKSISWLREYQKLLSVQQPQQEEQPPQQETPGQAPTDTSESKATRETKTTGEGMVEGSYHLEMLIKKIDAFATLVQRQQFDKAAVLADHINQIVEHFDPRLYLPKIFSKYYGFLSPNIEQMSGFWETRETPKWQSMTQLCQVDLDKFVNP